MRGKRQAKRERQAMAQAATNAAGPMLLGGAAGVDPLSSPGIASVMRWRRQTGFNPLVTLSALTLTRALDSFTRGELGEAALLWDAIAERDDIIPSVKLKRETAISDRKLEVSALNKSAEAARHKETLESFWRSVRWVDAWDRSNQGGAQKLVRRMQQAVSFRYQVHHIVWRPTRYGLRATFEAIPLWFFENRQARLRFLPNGMGQDGLELDEENWLVSCGAGLMIAGSIGYFFKRATLQDWLRFSELFSIPPVVGRTSAPEGSPEGTAMAEAVEAFGNDMKAVIFGDDGSGKIELIQANGSPQAMPMPALIERVDRRLAAMWRGADLSTMSSGMTAEGSGASVQADEKDLLERADAADRSEELQQIDRRVIAWTFGRGVEPLAQSEIVVPRPEDVRMILEAAKVFIDLGARIGKADLMGRFGLSEVSADEDAFGDRIDTISGQDSRDSGGEGRDLGEERDLADESADLADAANAGLERGERGVCMGVHLPGDAPEGGSEGLHSGNGGQGAKTAVFSGAAENAVFPGSETAAEGDPLILAMREVIALARVEDQAALSDEVRRILTLPDAAEVRQALLRLRDRLPDWVAVTGSQEDAWTRLYTAAVVEGLVSEGDGN